MVDPLALAHFATYIEKTVPGQRDVLLFCIDAERCRRHRGEAHEPSLRRALAAQFVTSESFLLKEAIRRGHTEFQSHLKSTLSPDDAAVGDDKSLPGGQGRGGRGGEIEEEGGVVSMAEGPTLSQVELENLYSVACRVLEETCLPAFVDSAEHSQLTAKHTEQV